MGWTDFVPIVGDIVDLIGNSMQSKDNWNMQQKQNQFNAKEAEKQREWASTERQASELFNHFQAIESRNWQEKMVNEQNEFNLPINQLRRMQDAGINPSLLQMDGSITSASPSGNPQASSSPLGGSSASSAGLIPAINPFNNVDPILSVLNARKLSAEIESLEDSNMRENEKQRYVIKTMQGDINFTNARRLLTDTSRKEIEAKMPLYQQELNNMRETFNGILLSNNLTKKELDSFDEEFKKRMRELDLEYNNKVKLGQKTVQEIENLIQSKNNMIKTGALLDEQTMAQLQTNLLNSVDVVYTLGNFDVLVQCEYDRATAEWNLFIQEQQLKQLDNLERQRVYKELNDTDWNATILRYVSEYSKMGAGLGASASGGASVSFNPITKKPTIKK